MKNGEITAIPKLLEFIEISGALVTIDAIGCQTAIAEKIIDAEADYCLAVKGNQPTLYKEINGHFAELVDADFKTEGDKKAIGRSINIVERDGGVDTYMEQHAVRYYILSRYLSASRFAEAVRDHWGIENGLHWQLDVTFGEDQSRVRKGHTDQNQSLLRRTSLSLLKNERTAKVGVKNKRLRAGWSEAYLAKVVSGA